MDSKTNSEHSCILHPFMTILWQPEARQNFVNWYVLDVCDREMDCTFVVCSIETLLQLSDTWTLGVEVIGLSQKCSLLDTWQLT